jgi:hypothetical protein
MRLNQFFIYLRNAIDSSDVGPTDGQRARLADLATQWEAHRQTLDAVLGADLAAFNQLVRDKGVPAIVPPEVPR